MYIFNVYIILFRLNFFFLQESSAADSIVTLRSLAVAEDDYGDVAVRRVDVSLPSADAVEAVAAAESSSAKELGEEKDDDDDDEDEEDEDEEEESDDVDDDREGDRAYADDFDDDFVEDDDGDDDAINTIQNALDAPGRFAVG